MWGELGFKDFNMDFYIKKVKKKKKKKGKKRRRRLIIELGKGFFWENAFVTAGTAPEAAGPGAPCGREDSSMTAALGSPGAHWRHILLSLLWKPAISILSLLFFMVFFVVVGFFLFFFLFLLFLLLLLFNLM